MASRFWVGGAGTWDASDTTHWSATSNGAGGQSVPGSGDTVTFDGSSGGGTVVVNTNVTVTSITADAFTGTLDFGTNNNTVTVNTFSCTGSATKTIITGSGLWTLNGLTGNILNFTTSANLTLTNTGWNVLISLSAAQTGSRSFLCTGKTCPTLTINDTAASQRWHQLVLAGTITTLVPTSVRNITVGSGSSFTVTNGFDLTGTLAVPIFVWSNGAAGTINLGGTTNFTYCYFANVTKGGAGTANTTNCWDGLGNSGWTINAPSASGSLPYVIG